jgi:hypothetical protein
MVVQAPNTIDAILPAADKLNIFNPALSISFIILLYLLRNPLVLPLKTK